MQSVIEIRVSKNDAINWMKEIKLFMLLLFVRRLNWGLIVSRMAVESSKESPDGWNENYRYKNKCDGDSYVHVAFQLGITVQRLSGLLVDLGKGIFDLLVGFVLAQCVYSPDRSRYPANQGNLQQQTNDASKRSTYGEEGEPGQEQGNQQSHCRVFQKLWGHGFKQCIVAAALGIYFFMQEGVAELKRTGFLLQERTVSLWLGCICISHQMFQLCLCFTGLSSGRGHFAFQRILFNTGSLHAIR